MALGGTAMADNIVETAQEAGTFETLLAAAQAAGLADALATGENLTVFAPTDDAFAALPDGTVEDLLQPENPRSTRGYPVLSCPAACSHIEPAPPAVRSTFARSGNPAIDCWRSARMRIPAPSWWMGPTWSQPMSWPITG